MGEDKPGHIKRPWHSRLPAFATGTGCFSACLPIFAIHRVSIIGLDIHLVSASFHTSMEHPTITGIAGIPTELLLEIGACITLVDPHHRSLCLLAQTCRRFYALFKPHIIAHIADCVFKCCVTTKLKSNGIEYPIEPDATSRVLLEKRLTSVYVPFTQDDTFDSIRCLRSLIFNARRITSITISLCTANLNSPVLVCLLNSCVQRPEMELKITETGVVNLRQLDFQNDEGPFGSSRKAEGQHSTMLQDKRNRFNATIVHNIKHLLSGGTSISSDRILSNATPPLTIAQANYLATSYPRSPPKLNALGITGDILFSPIMYPWTRHILNTAPLTRLSITRVQLSTVEWSRILPSISIPTLIHLAVGSISVSFQDLLAFLSRHPRLRTLDLSSNTLRGSTSFPASLSKSTFLPDLSLITAPPTYIRLFTQRRRRGYCPKLTAFRNTHVKTPHHQ